MMYVHHGQSAKWSLFFYFVFFVPKSRTFRKYGVNDGVHEKKISMNAFLGNTKHSSVNRKLGGGVLHPPPPPLPVGFPLTTHRHSVNFYLRLSCQIWYPYLAPVSGYWAKFRRGYLRFLDCHKLS